MCKNPLYKSLDLHNYNQLVSVDEFKKGKAIQINCSKCFYCLVKKIKNIQSRFALHIKDLNDQKNDYYCYFITLTYDNDNLHLTQLQNSKNEVQKMIKRWRKNYKLKKLKYVITTELGSTTGRIHHHAFIVSEKNFLPKMPGGKKLKNNFYYYQNKKISWPFGFHSIKLIDTTNYKNIQNTLSYVLKYIFKSPVQIMISKKIGYDAINNSLDQNDNTYLFNGYKYKAPWAQNNLPNTEKMKLSLLTNQNQKTPKQQNAFFKGSQEPEQW